MKPQDTVIREGDILLRPITEEDIEAIRLWRNREEVRSQFVYDQIISREAQEQWYRSYLDKEDDIVWMAVDAASGEKLGTVSLYDIDAEMHGAEVGRLIVPKENRRRGLGKLLLALAIRYAFEKLGSRTIRLSIFYDNLASMKINLALGFIPCDAVEYGGRYLIQLKLKKEDFHDLYS